MIDLLYPDRALAAAERIAGACEGKVITSVFAPLMCKIHQRRPDLSQDDREEIKRLHFDEGYSFRKLQRETGYSKEYCRDIIQGKYDEVSLCQSEK